MKKKIILGMIFLFLSFWLKLNFGNVVIFADECKHEWSTEYVIDKKPTCTDDGQKSVHCIKCDKIKEDSIKIIEATHKWKDTYEIDQQATLSSEGVESIHCTICKEIKKGSKRVIGTPIIKVNPLYYSYVSQKPSFTITDTRGNKLYENKDYILKYKNEADIGTYNAIIEFQGKYSGSIEKKYSIQEYKPMIKNYVGVFDRRIHTIQLEKIPDDARVYYSVNGKEYSEGKIYYSTVGTYKIYYKIKRNNFEDIAGVATVKITPLDINKLKNIKFIFLKSKPHCSRKNGKYTYSYGINIQYCGAEGNSQITNELVYNKEYKLSYKNNTSIGKATLIVNGIGNYCGTKILYFNIVPDPVYAEKAKAGKKKATVYWEKESYRITGYKIQYSRKKNMKGAKIKTVNSKKKSLVIKKLSSKKKYYFRVRAYKKVKGKNYYGDWSYPVSAKIK